MSLTLLCARLVFCSYMLHVFDGYSAWDVARFDELAWWRLCRAKR